MYISVTNWCKIHRAMSEAKGVELNEEDKKFHEQFSTGRYANFAKLASL